MKKIATPLKDCFLIEPTVHGDSRGFFLESFNQRLFNEMAEENYTFVQDNHSLSKKGVLRGLHYQLTQPQGKLVRVVSGEVFDVAVDARKSSPTFGKWFGVLLSAENKKIFWVPPGFAHGFLVVSEQAEFLYKTTDYYLPGDEKTIMWNDPDLNIDWQQKELPFLSTKDMNGEPFKSVQVFN